MTTRRLPRQGADRWRTATEPRRAVPGQSVALFPATRVVGEIKPHNTQQIREGILQLRRRRALDPAGAGTTYQLVTYRQVRDDPTRYDVLVADRAELDRRVRSTTREFGIARWHDIGQVRLQAAAAPIPLWRCTTLLGSALEPEVRARYQGWMRQVTGNSRLTLARKTSASQSGADLVHETADFLRELAAELAEELAAEPGAG